MYRELSLIAVRHIFYKILYHFTHLVRSCVSYGVGNIEHLCAVFNSGIANSNQEIRVRTHCILAGKFDVRGVFSGIPNHCRSTLNNLLGCHFKFIFHMYGRGCNKCMNSGVCCIFHSLPSRIDVLFQSS